MKKAMTERSVRFSSKQWQLIQKYAEEFDMSCSEVLRMIVNLYFGVREKGEQE